MIIQKVIAFLISPDELSILIHSLFVGLYNCPELKTHFKFLNFVPLSLKNFLENYNKVDKKDVYPYESNYFEPLFEGAMGYFKQVSTNKDEGVQIGFSQGRMIVGLHLIEIMIKRFLSSYNIGNLKTHNLLKLYNKIPIFDRIRIGKIYPDFYWNKSWIWDFSETVESFLRFLGKDPITSTRYFWDSEVKLLFMPNRLVCLIHALIIGLHNYPYKQIIRKGNGPVIESFNDSWNSGIYPTSAHLNFTETDFINHFIESFKEDGRFKR